MIPQFLDNPKILPKVKNLINQFLKGTKIKFKTKKCIIFYSETGLAFINMLAMVCLFFCLSYHSSFCVSGFDFIPYFCLKTKLHGKVLSLLCGSCQVILNLPHIIVVISLMLLMCTLALASFTKYLTILRLPFLQAIRIIIKCVRNIV